MRIFGRWRGFLHIVWHAFDRRDGPVGEARSQQTPFAMPRKAAKIAMQFYSFCLPQPGCSTRRFRRVLLIARLLIGSADGACRAEPFPSLATAGLAQYK